jgi:hypothetical protein
MAQLMFGETREEKGEKDGVVAHADQGGLTVDCPEQGAGFGRAQDEIETVIFILGLEDGMQRVGGLG